MIIGSKQTIKGLLQAGFDVLAVFMPHVSETGCNLDHCSVMNTDTARAIILQLMD